MTRAKARAVEPGEEWERVQTGAPVVVEPARPRRPKVLTVIRRSKDERAHAFVRPFYRSLCGVEVSETTNLQDGDPLCSECERKLDG